MDRTEIHLFFQGEAQIKINGIASKETKLNSIVSQLESKYFENIWDIVTSNFTSNYSESKARLLDAFKKAKALEFKNLLLEVV